MTPDSSNSSSFDALIETRKKDFAVARERFRTFASEVGAVYVAQARISKKDFEHLAKMFDFRETWVDWLFKEFDHDMHQKFKLILEKVGNLSESDFEQSIAERIAVDCEFRSFSIRLQIDENHHSENGFMLMASALVEQKNQFSITLRKKPDFDLGGGDVIERKPPADWAKKLTSVGLHEWIEALPKKEYRLAFKAPMLQDKFRATATERLLGELFINDQRLRTSLLNIRKMLWFNLCYPDPLSCNTQSLLYRGHLGVDDVRHLKDILKLMQDALQVGVDLDVIAR